MNESFFGQIVAKFPSRKSPARQIPWEAEIDAQLPDFWYGAWALTGICIVLPSIAIFILVVITYFWDMHKSTSGSQKFLEPFFWWVWFLASFAIAFILHVAVHVVHLITDEAGSWNLDSKGRSLGRRGLHALYTKLAGGLFLTWAIYLLLFGIAFDLDNKCVSPSPFTQSKMTFEAAYNQSQSNCVVSSKTTIVLSIVGIGIIILTMKKVFFEIWNYAFILVHRIGWKQEPTEVKKANANINMTIKR